MIDSHCHIDLYHNPEKVALNVEKANIKTIAVTNLPSHFEIGYPHVKNYRNVSLALGYHPLFVTDNNNELPKFKKLIEKTSFVGEIGLDFSKMNTNTGFIDIYDSKSSDGVLAQKESKNGEVEERKYLYKKYLETSGDTDSSSVSNLG